jgi:hypothetical protein
MITVFNAVVHQHDPLFFGSVPYQQFRQSFCHLADRETFGDLKASTFVDVLTGLVRAQRIHPYPVEFREHLVWRFMTFLRVFSPAELAEAWAALLQLAPELSREQLSKIAARVHQVYGLMELPHKCQVFRSLFECRALELLQLHEENLAELLQPEVFERPWMVPILLRLWPQLRNEELRLGSTWHLPEHLEFLGALVGLPKLSNARFFPEYLARLALVLPEADGEQLLMVVKLVVKLGAPLDDDWWQHWVKRVHQTSDATSTLAAVWPLLERLRAPAAIRQSLCRHLETSVLPQVKEVEWLWELVCQEGTALPAALKTAIVKQLEGLVPQFEPSELVILLQDLQQCEYVLTPTMRTAVMASLTPAALTTLDPASRTVLAGVLATWNFPPSFQEQVATARTESESTRTASLPIDPRSRVIEA